MMKSYTKFKTYFNGKIFNNRLDASWGAFFDMMDIDYNYDPLNKPLNFYLKTFNCGLIVFDRLSPALEDIGINACKRKAVVEDTTKFLEEIDKSAIIAFGNPLDNDMWLVACETDDDGGGISVDTPISFGTDEKCFNKPVLYTIDYKERIYYDKVASFNGEEIPIRTLILEKDVEEDNVDAAYLNTPSTKIYREICNFMMENN